jgi:hypothetical protein
VEKLKEFLSGRKRSYQLAFGSPAGQKVLMDLAVFCRANENAAVPGDDHRTWMAIGRREVWLRIQQHMNLNSDELYALFAGNGINPKEGQ